MILVAADRATKRCALIGGRCGQMPKATTFSPLLFPDTKKLNRFAITLSYSRNFFPVWFPSTLSFLSLHPFNVLPLSCDFNTVYPFTEMKSPPPPPPPSPFFRAKRASKVLTGAFARLKAAGLTGLALLLNSSKSLTFSCWGINTGGICHCCSLTVW